MLDGSLDDTCDVTLQGNLASLYEVVPFTDSETSGSYCVLAEIARIGDANKKAWGTFITRRTPSRELHIQVAHPLSDTDTYQQSIYIFRSVGARSFLLSGADRSANNVDSSCHGESNSKYDFKEAVAAHNIVHMFQPTTEAVEEWHDARSTEFVVIQFHGFDFCGFGVGAFITYAGPYVPDDGDRIKLLQNKLDPLLPLSVTIPTGFLDCAYNGGSNVQGRFLSGMSSVEACGNDIAPSYTERFVHIEQVPAIQGRQHFSAWSTGISALWCTIDADCDDGLFCNGVETCNAATGKCQSGSDPCRVSETCNDNTDTCTGGGGGGGGSFFCFAGDNVVTVRGKGDIPMRDLMIGDSVLVEADTFERTGLQFRTQSYTHRSRVSTDPCRWLDAAS